MKALVKRYKQDTKGIDGKLRDQLILDYASLIRFIAQKVSVKLPSNVDVDDLISAGVIGLMDAIDKYDPSRENKFKTYAEFRIRGAILDELRSQDWVPRTIRDKSKKIDRTISELEKRHGRSVTDEELAQELDMSLDEYYDMVASVKCTNLVSIDEFVSEGSGYEKKNFMDNIDKNSNKNPLDQMKNKDLRASIIQYIEELPEKYKLVLSLYYFEDLNLREIGRVLSVTESRVSQLHTQAMLKLKEKLMPALKD